MRTLCNFVSFGKVYLGFLEGISRNLRKVYLGFLEKYI